MDRDRQMLQLSDGRFLCWAEHGPADADVTLLSLHGTPGCRLNRWPDEELFHRAGVREITYDRAGYGGSTRRPGRQVVDVVPDVVALLDAAGVERVAVRGTSGGGPHVLAVAARLSERIERAMCVVGPAPYDALSDWTAGMDPENVKEFGLALQGEDVLVRELQHEDAELRKRFAQDPATIFGGFELSAADRTALAHPMVVRMLTAAVPEQTRDGVWGWVDDDRALIQPWGFDVAEIAATTLVRYGARDVMTPPAHGRWLAEHIPGATVHLETGGHLGDPQRDIERVLAWARTGRFE